MHDSEIICFYISDVDLAIILRIILKTVDTTFHALALQPVAGMWILLLQSEPAQPESQTRITFLVYMCWQQIPLPGE